MLGLAGWLIAYMVPVGRLPMARPPPSAIQSLKLTGTGLLVHRFDDLGEGYLHSETKPGMKRESVFAKGRRIDAAQKTRDLARGAQSSGIVATQAVQFLVRQIELSQGPFE